MASRAEFERVWCAEAQAPVKTCPLLWVPAGAAWTAWRTSASWACRSTAAATLCSWPSPPAWSRCRSHAASATGSARSTSDTCSSSSPVLSALAPSSLSHLSPSDLIAHRSSLPASCTPCVHYPPSLAFTFQRSAPTVSHPFNQSVKQHQHLDHH